jgi:hypothetical protein
MKIDPSGGQITFDPDVAGSRPVADREKYPNWPQPEPTA